VRVVGGGSIIAAAVAAFLLSGCQIGGDGEGPRFTGRVVSVTPHEVCVGPNSTRPRKTCGSVPDGTTDLPSVGQCVSLFAHTSDQGKTLNWTAASLRLTVPTKQCSGR
jgi:hypothetical protein